MIIPFVELNTQYKSIKKEIDEAIKRVLTNGIFIGGEEIPAFEKEFARFIGAKHCIAVNSGTDALILGMRALGIKTGDEVIVPANTFIATALGATENGLKPVFVDADETDNGINLADLKKKINDRTKAITLVHLYGQPDKIAEVQETIRKSGKKIHLVEDAAQSHGAYYQGYKSGTYGVFSIFSFYPGKNLGAYGDGGAITTNNDKLAERYRLLHEYGARKKYYHDSLGINSRLDTIQAAILRIKLKHLSDWNKKRQELAAYYTSQLTKKVPAVITPTVYRERKSIYHLYVIRTKKRDQLMKHLKEKNITTLIHYPIPLHLQKAFKYLGYKEGDFPVAEKLAGEILSLPMYPELTKKQIDYIVDSIAEINK